MLISKSSVLVVDGLDELREVLRTALERRRVRVLEAMNSDDGMVMARLHRPDVVVLDLEAANCAGATEEFSLLVENYGGTLLILGSFQSTVVLAGGEYMSKPYHYKPLILRIEELLRRPVARAAA